MVLFITSGEVFEPFLKSLLKKNINIYTYKTILLICYLNFGIVLANGNGDGSVYYYAQGVGKGFVTTAGGQSSIGAKEITYMRRYKRKDPVKALKALLRIRKEVGNKIKL